MNISVMNDHELDDEQLALCVAARESIDRSRAAFLQLYQRHSEQLRWFLAGRTRRENVEEFHQEVWTRVWLRLPNGYKADNFRAWLFRTARNYMIDHSRKKRSEALPPDISNQAADRQPTDQQLLDAEEAELLAECLEILDSIKGSLIRGRLAGHSYDQLCQELGINTARAHKLFFQAKNQLTDCVQQKLT